jgi:hypothetical protein
MRQAEVTIGGRYFAKVGGDLVIVRITARTPYRRGRLDVFEAENTRTGRPLAADRRAAAGPRRGG